MKSYQPWVQGSDVEPEIVWTFEAFGGIDGGADIKGCTGESIDRDLVVQKYFLTCPDATLKPTDLVKELVKSNTSK